MLMIAPEDPVIDVVFVASSSAISSCRDINAIFVVQKFKQAVAHLLGTKPGDITTSGRSFDG